MRWWGWGDPAQPPALAGARARAILREHVGVGERAPPAGGAGPVRPAAFALGERTLDRAAGDPRRRRGQRRAPEPGAPRGRQGLPGPGADARRRRPRARPTPSSSPPPRAGDGACCALCARASLAVVPFGGGTSVVGGVAPLRGEHAARDRARHAAHGARCSSSTARSRTVTVQAGIRAPALEGQLAGRGLTLGHYPQSFEYVSIGGCAATRSAGQASTRLRGDREDGARAAPCGPRRRDRRCAPIPATAAGPGLRAAAGRLGGHARGDHRALAAGALGAARTRVYEGIFFAGFAAGVRGASRARARARAARRGAALRRAARRAVADAGRTGRLQGPLGRAYLGLRGYREGLPGDPRLRGRRARRSASRRARAMELVRAQRRPRRWGARRVRPGCGGASPAPYLRDDLLSRA